MIAIVQRSGPANVTVAGEVVGQIERGLVALVAVHRADTADDVQWMAGKLASLRIFPDGDKHFDLDIRQAGGAMLLVSNFTVAARTRKGRRPSFDDAADGPTGQALFDSLVQALRDSGITVATGIFGADMRVSITNDGPATFILNSKES